MINPKYFGDIQSFPEQLAHQFNVTIPDHYPKHPRIIICGMGGSALYVPLVQNLLAYHQIDCRLDVCSTYTLPPCDASSTLIVCASHSGNTEETLHCFDEAKATKSLLVVFTSGGTLLERTTKYHIPTYHIPTGLQPRLCTGYFIMALLDLLAQCGYAVETIRQHLHQAAHHLHDLVSPDYAHSIASQLRNHTPIIYTTDVLSSMSLISKIKLNENSKTPAFAHYIPELNHNEMCGWMGHTMQPHFLIFTSAYTHHRNLRRIDVMHELLQKEGYPVTIITPQGDSLEAEALWIYHLMDYISYSLAELQNIDPEPVRMVEEFKKALR